MRVPVLFTCILLIAFLAATPLAAQNRGDSGAVAGRGVADAGGSAGAPSTTSTSTISYSGGGSSYSPGSYSSDYAGRAFTGGTPSISSQVLVGSSFCTTHLYNDWNDYYSYLYRYYSLSPTYFTRFMRNYEPLMTPAMLRITLRQPLFLSAEMLKLIDQLQLMYDDMQAGKAVDRQAFIAKSEMIRALARQIRQDRTLSMIDIRKETDVYKNSGNAFSAESIKQLREMTLNLISQLNEMYNLSASSTISVSSYAEPSFTSVTKGIEKACKAIEKSSKRL